MPTYEYECAQCEQTFDFFQSMKDEPLKDCPQCGAQGSVKRLIGGGAGLIFKGSGFYITDYKKSNCSGTPAKSNGKASGESSGGGCACPGADSCPVAQANKE